MSIGDYDHLNLYVEAFDEMINALCANCFGNKDTDVNKDNDLLSRVNISDEAIMSKFGRALREVT